MVTVAYKKCESRQWKWKRIPIKNTDAIFGGNKVGIIFLVTCWGGAFHLSTTNTCWFGHRPVWFLIWTVTWEFLYWIFMFLLMTCNDHLDFLEQDSHTHSSLFFMNFWHHICWVYGVFSVSPCSANFTGITFFIKSSWLHCAGSLCQFVTKRGRRLVISFLLFGVSNWFIGLSCLLLASLQVLRGRGCFAELFFTNI